MHFGVLEGIEFDVATPVAFSTAAGASSQRGYGDTTLDLKWRLVKESEGSPLVSLVPKFTIPTGNSAKGLGNGGSQVFLALAAQKSADGFQTYGNAGYWINNGPDNRNYWFVGGQTQYKFSDHWIIGAEVFHTTSQTQGQPASTGFNVGGYYMFDPRRQLLFSAGRGLQNAAETNRVSVYLGFQMSFYVQSIATKTQMRHHRDVKTLRGRQRRQCLRCQTASWRLGFTILVANSGEQGVALAASEKPTPSLRISGCRCLTAGSDSQGKQQRKRRISRDRASAHAMSAIARRHWKPAEDYDIADTSIAARENTGAPAERNDMSERSGPGEAAKRICVEDSDDSLFVRTCCDLLTKVSSNGKEAVEWAKHLLPDLIVMILIFPV